MVPIEPNKMVDTVPPVLVEGVRATMREGVGVAGARGVPAW